MNPITMLVVFGVGVFCSNKVALPEAISLFATDCNLGNIYEFTPDGSQTIFATGLSWPTGLAFDSSGNLFVATEDAIYKYTPGGNRSTFATGIHQSRALAFDNGGSLFVSSWGTDTIYKFTTSGIQSTFATGLPDPTVMAFDSGGNLFVACGRNILRFTPSGSQSVLASERYGLQGLACNSSGSLFAVEMNSGWIYEYATNGSRSVFYGTGVYSPTYMACDSNGNLFVGDSGWNCIREFTPSKASSVFVTGFMNGPAALAFGPSTVPEPSTLVLLGGGVMGLLVLAWNGGGRGNKRIGSR